MRKAKKATTRTQRRRAKVWLTKGEMCRVFDVSATGFDRHIRPHFPLDCIRILAGGKLAFDGRRCIEAWALYFAERHSVATDEDDIPAIPKARREYYQALWEKLRYERETGKLIPNQVAERRWGEIAGFHLQVLDSLPGQLAVKLGNKTLGERRKVLKDFARGVRRLVPEQANAERLLRVFWQNGTQNACIFV